MSPVFLDGQQNLAALTVPGVYGDIILPTPLLLGTPTNIEGVVGVGSWGPLNSLIPISKPVDCAVQIGPPKIRNRDIASYVGAACQVGGAIGFLAVRVSDGTDVAATATVATGGIQATGFLSFSGNPANNDTVTINGTVITFTGAMRGGTLNQTLLTLITALQDSNDANLSLMTYVLVGTQINITAVTAGVAGNAYTLAKTSAVITVSGATLSGGAAGGGTGITLTAKYSGTLGNAITFSIQNGSKANTYLANIAFPGLVPEQFNNIGGAGNTFWVNLANAINNGTIDHAPSQIVVGSAGASTAAPTLSTVTTLTGGTDGDTGVTDATLVGQDIVPRKGMYCLRGANVDGFTLCDLTTIGQYAAIVSFSLSETAIGVFGSVSGDTISNCLSTRVSAALDSPWFWLILGDWATWWDAYNGISRNINPSAFGLGILGNLSPQQSPLNKPLQGISATQRTTLGQTYSDAELALINQGGIDTILGPMTSPGGYYFSFATGRNSSSNTAANGIEYTRMTNFLIRTAQSKAAGSFVGRLQSIQPNDLTRAQAKALFDGLSAQLASPQVGLGIGGQGMIDTPWLVTCDLTNNPPNLQALGYLFLYWQVRYLNVIRYFVVKFMGGGNVQVNVQSQPPNATQFTSTNPNVLVA
jgi:Bacteriophage tail sheath protein